MKRLPLQMPIALLIGAVLAAGCDRGGEADTQTSARRTPVTVAQASRQRVEAAEVTVGRLEATAAPDLDPLARGRPGRHPARAQSLGGQHAG